MQSARDQFPGTRIKTIYICAAWHPEHATTGKSAPEDDGWDGWSRITTEEATIDAIEQLAASGYTHVSLEPASTRFTSVPVPISALSY